MNQAEGFSDKDKVNILLKEYDTLRSEILTRTNGGFQLIAIGAGVFALSVQHLKDYVIWVSLSGGVIGLWIFSYFILRDCRMCARRIRQIEANVNSLVGETLLQWETSWGALATGWLVRSTKPGKPATHL